MDIQELLAASKAATVSMAGASTTQKNLALEGIAKELEANVSEIIAANELDLAAGEQSGLSRALQDRLRLDAHRVTSLASAVREIISLPDPVGDSVQGRTLANGLMIQQVRVPFGVIGCIYEARPNVTVDIAALAIKSGNCAVLRGGSAAENTNKVLISLIQKGLIGADLPSSAVATVDPFGRNGAVELMQARGLVDVLIPRGSANLIHTVVTESKVPVIETGDGIVHIFADASANVELAIPIIVNSKAQRPSVCNSLETLLVHEQVAAELLPKLAKALAESSVLVHACEQSIALMPGSIPATDKDWATEYLGLELSVRIVNSLDQAIAHISKYSTKHTESILTESIANAERFLQEIDSAVVMVNSSTRFTDGGEFGLGAEVGISTQKLHARGPMGLRELTSTKWLVRGNGQVRS
ncbi:glutamate-5-semialdehyde dehydrogenase [Aquiluna sp.]|nr:glutamate-5-semialdehyde dehydrogenase [Aquiluna sp.]MDA8902027.1 glutamate-5-semialdehyde dehydrogenase [Aquiluna sp.]MDA8992933.1 glutamate-5-semialdehyde dehydrogenase [Aquiluna sp.]